MEEESFENIQVAKILNEHFIAIKVDREQHPDNQANKLAMRYNNEHPDKVILRT